MGSLAALMIGLPLFFEKRDPYEEPAPFRPKVWLVIASRMLAMKDVKE